MPPKMRLDSLFDSTYEIIEPPKDIDPDPLNFEVKDGAREGYKYIDKIKKYREVTKQHTALLCGSGTISGLSAVTVCFARKFGSGRFGTAENEHFLKAARFAIEKKVSIWIVIYQSSGIDVHAGVMALAGMTKSVIAMDEIKKAGIPTFAVAGSPGPVSGGTYASSYYQHDFIIIESRDVENILFSGKRVTANILKGTDSIPINFGTQSGVMEAGLADITLESRKKLKQTITTLTNIILKKEASKTTDEAYENPEDFKKTASTTS
jgi:acetyl-CoA carboxylase carboxyl transferase subunit beta